jgi:hypothetical protein
MKLPIKNSQDFEKLLDALASDIVMANIYFNHHRSLKLAANDYLKEFNESVTFWNILFQSLLDATMYRLCRIYDAHKKSNSLPNLLDTIHENLYIFDESDFRVRLKDNPFVDSLAKSARKPDPKQLTEDVAYASDANPLVKNLRTCETVFFSTKVLRLFLKDDKSPMTIRSRLRISHRCLKQLSQY